MTLARTTDPSTSHQAAQSVSVLRHRQWVLAAISDFGPMTDEAMVSLLDACELQISPSSARTRRCELVRMGLVRESGLGVTRSGRSAVRWEAT
jgi:hypothetical protein